MESVAKQKCSGEKSNIVNIKVSFLSHEGLAGKVPDQECAESGSRRNCVVTCVVVTGHFKPQFPHYDKSTI